MQDGVCMSVSVGWLVVLNWIVIPFYYEFVALTSELKGVPPCLSVLKLRNFIAQRWMYGYCIFLCILVALELAPSRSGREHYVHSLLLILFVLLQVVLGVLAFVRANKFKSFNK
jgi:quinol-cytochrome oxidoreductase complex cytochrome b subunit